MMRDNLLKKIFVFILSAVMFAGMLNCETGVSASSAPGKPAVSLKADSGGKGFTITIGKTTGATGYKVMMKGPSDSKYQKVKTFNTDTSVDTTLTLDNLAYGKYYVKVLAFTRVKGKVIWGKYCKAKKITLKKPVLKASSFKTGDIVRFGSFEQDADTKNGKESLEWIVLSNDGKELFLVSRYVLTKGVIDPGYYYDFESEDYDEDTGEIDPETLAENKILTWEECALRGYLNGDFFKETFNDKEAAVIADTELTDVNTVDKVFLLSEEEVTYTPGVFYDSDKFRRCGCTTYASANGLWVCNEYMDDQVHKADDGKYSCYWWLRSAGTYPNEFLLVSETGSLISNEACGEEMETVHEDDDGEIFYVETFGVRPAIKVKLSKDALKLLTLTGVNVAKEIKTAESIKDEIVDISQAKQGDVVTFGAYEQDNDLKNGQEPIKWIVLQKTKNQLLVMSKYALDVQPFNIESRDVSWEDSSLRQWLNEDFYNTAFSDEEKQKIITKTVKNDKNPYYKDSEAGEDTKDKVFLLSIDEATNTSYGFNADRKNYDDLRKCAVTGYAVSRGVYITEDTTPEGVTTTIWWLRTVGEAKDEAAYVIGHGYIRIDGWYVETASFAIRPVIAISLK